MTVIYVPVKIESAEQAEALPRGTFIRLSIMSDSWTRLDSPEYRAPYETDEVPFTALVPIEAEETRDEGTGWIVPTAFGPKLMGAYLGRPDDTPAKRYTQTIWRTHWTPTEEA